MMEAVNVAPALAPGAVQLFLAEFWNEGERFSIARLRCKMEQDATAGVERNGRTIQAG